MASQFPEEGIIFTLTDSDELDGLFFILAIDRLVELEVEVFEDVVYFET
jgi:hypothetical protein